MTNTINIHKNGILLAYIANKIPNIQLRKLLKIVFLIDETFTITRGYPITWFNYYAWAKGPVAKEVYNIKNGNFDKYVNAHQNENSKWIVNSNESSEYQIFSKMDDFSRAEIKLIDSILEKYSNKTADELTDLTHQQTSIWSRVVSENNLSFTKEKTSDIQIPLTLLLEGNDALLEIYEDAKWNLEFQGLLK